MNTLYIHLCAITAATALIANASADEVELGSKVRIQSTTLTEGWHEGKLVEADDCLAVTLDSATHSGLTIILLGLLSRLELQKDDQWINPSAAALLQGQPERCRTAAAKEAGEAEKNPVH